MSKIRLTGSNSGYVEIASAADAGNLTFVLPTSGTSLLGNGNNVHTGITTHQNDFKLEGGSYDVLWDASDNQLEFDNNAILSFGGSSDLQLYHTGNHSIIKNGTGNLILQDDNYIVLEKIDGTNMLVAAGGGSVDLYFSGSKKIETTNTGAIVTGIMTATEINYTGSQNLSNRNKIINGGMVIAQRTTSATVSTSATGYKTVDRFSVSIGGNTVFVMSQSGDHPEGFSKSMKFDCTTAVASPAAGDSFRVLYKGEGYDVQDIGKGTSGAKPVTLSFYIKTNKTGNYQVNWRDLTNSRMVCGTYTVNSPNTWERKVITFPTETSNGELINDNSAELYLEWWFIAGSTANSGTAHSTWDAYVNANRAANLNVSIGDSTDNVLYLTGVQLEIGSVATPFEHRSFLDDYLRCCRYYFGGANTYVTGSVYYGSVYSSGNSMVRVPHPVPMRSTPTASQPSQGGGGTFTQVYENTTITQYYFSGDTSVNVPVAEVDISAEL